MISNNHGLISNTVVTYRLKRYSYSRIQDIHIQFVENDQVNSNMNIVYTDWFPG